MKRRSGCFLLLVLVALSNTAFATNWVYVGRSDLFQGNVYIDSDTVLKDGTNLIFWDLEKLDKSDMQGDKKKLWKVEAKLNDPRQRKILERYNYDVDNRVNFHNTKADDAFHIVEKGSLAYAEIEIALAYAKDGKDSGSVPAP
jgi:hypothetical protein